MRKHLRRAWRIFRAIVSVLLLILVVVPLGVYVLVALDPVQSRLRNIASTELSNLLGAEVGIGSLVIHPMDRISVGDVTLSIQGDTVARVARLKAGIELMPLLHSGTVAIDYVLIDGIEAHLSREADSLPLNIQPVVEHLRSDRPKGNSKIDLRVNTIIVRHGTFTYDVTSAPEPDPGHFDRRHIAVNDLALNAYIPAISGTDYRVSLDHMSMRGRSGFVVDHLAATAAVSDSAATVSDLTVALPATYLSFDPIRLRYRSLGDIAEGIRRHGVTVRTTSGTIYPPDMQAFAPVLGRIRVPMDLALDASGTPDDVKVHSLKLSADGGRALQLTAIAKASGIGNRDSLTYDLSHLSLKADGPALSEAAADLIPHSTAAILRRIGTVTAQVNGTGTAAAGHADITVQSRVGRIASHPAYALAQGHPTVAGTIAIDSLDLAAISGKALPQALDAGAEYTLSLGRHISGEVHADVLRALYMGHTYTGINLDARLSTDGVADAYLSVDDSTASLTAALTAHTRGHRRLQADVDVNRLDLWAMNLDTRREGYVLSGTVTADLATGATTTATAKAVDSLEGYLRVGNLRWTDRHGHGPRLGALDISLHPYDDEPHIDILSDYIRGTLRGQYSFTTLVPDVKALCARFLPALFPDEIAGDAKRSRRHGHSADPTRSAQNNFRLNLELLPSRDVTDFFGLPVHIIHTVEIGGRLNSAAGKGRLSISAPYLEVGRNLWEGSDVFVNMDAAEGLSAITATTQFPTKKGDMKIDALVKCADNQVDTHIDWLIARTAPINGSIDLSCLLRDTPRKRPDAISPIDALLNINPGSINFGDDTWSIAPARIDITPTRIDIADFALIASDQHITIDGSIGPQDTDSIAVDLRNVAILPIFETLEIDKAYIGGRATGTVKGADLLSGAPYLQCPRLHVDSIGYQYVTIGDADIEAHWDNARRAVSLDADITGPEGCSSRIYGDIVPVPGALDLTFDVDSVPVGFLRPFLSGFASDVTGRAGGKVRLFGTFQDVDIEGDVRADNVGLAIDFLGTTFYASDSLHLRPGRIILPDITIRDVDGHTAVLDGQVRHRYFHDASFRFDITQARDLLCYNVSETSNPHWYGTIYTRGNASINGRPGVVNVDVDMSTAPRSTFTFVLSDRLDAEVYSFLSFRDITPDSLRITDVTVDSIPPAIRAYKEKKARTDDTPSAYNIDLRIGVTKDADINLIMDPVAGDAIRTHGEGNLRLVYRSLNDDLNIWGKYSILDGNYRFTLQDIIIRDFTIREGSQISFDGDPYAVKANIQAYYATNANLSDLDESFLQDKDISRTNVPVHALMNVTGDIRQPAIDFDLEFPTLTSDTYRKVRSIVSTSDMMNRQIIYLLTLNRFYTPDYMAATTKGSELFSVASSTLSSQLSNMLGKLSDKWTIAPNLRSDRGDFSDVEVDVALSSRLLNNRLLFNGNLGYRDKSLNSNQFVGDFDIEYLLNKRGTLRLKAYNRYNDRNFYVRSALTTQGVGIMFRHDFDTLFKRR